MYGTATVFDRAHVLLLLLLLLSILCPLMHKLNKNDLDLK